MTLLAPNALVHDRYRVIHIIGRGGMGAVYEALDTRLQSRVALKQLTIKGTEVEQAFWREAHLLSGLRHAGLPRVIDYFEADSNRFLVMDYIEGEDLLARIRRQYEPLDVDLVLDWTEQVLEVLVYLHERTPPVIHRDLKPANLKLAERNRIVVLDFGLAKGTLALATASPQTTPSLFAASPQYAPLEQLRGTGTSARSDLYSLGATMFHLLSGGAPPSALDRSGEIVEGRRDPLDDWEPRSPVTDAVKDIVRTAMRLNMAERYRSAMEMRDAVQALAATAAERVEAARARAEATTKPAARIAATDPTITDPPLDAPSRENQPDQEAAGPAAIPIPPHLADPESRGTDRASWRHRTIAIATSVALLLLVGLFLALGLPSSNGTDGSAGRNGPAATREFVVTLDALIGPGAPEAAAGKVESPGAMQAYLFDVAAQDRVFIRTISHDAGAGGLHLQFIDPEMREIVGTCLACGDLGVQSVATSGRHRLLVGANGQDTGSYRLGINRVPPAQECAVERPAQADSAVATVQQAPGTLGAGCGAIAVPGDTDIYLIDLVARESFRVDSLSRDPEVSALDVTLLDESGLAIASTLLEALPLNASIERSGRYRLRVGSDRNPATGSYSLRFTFARD